MAATSNDLDLDGDGEYVPGLLSQEEGLDDEELADDELGEDVEGPGYSPVYRPLESFGWGVTAYEARTHEPFDLRLARELPDVQADDGDGLGDASDTDGELIDDQVGERRAGRLVWRPLDRTDADLLATDIGIDGAAASAEEAAIHIVPDDADEADDGRF
jgi:hypothetical protein